MANANHSEAVDEVPIADENHQAVEGIVSSINPEEQAENGEKSEGLETGLKGENSSSLKVPLAGEDAEQENALAEETEIEQEHEIKTEETKEGYKHLEGGGDENDDEEGSKSEPGPGRESCSQSDLEAAAKIKDAQAEMENNGAVEENEPNSHPSDQGRTDLAIALGTIPQVCHFSSPITLLFPFSVPLCWLS